MNELGEATVKVVPDLTGFGEALSGAVDAAIEKIGEKAVKVTINDDGPPPVRTYGPEGALIALHSRDEGGIDESAQSTLAETVEVINRHGRFSLKINGQEFPWYISDAGVQTQVSPNNVGNVTVTILANYVSIVDDWS